MMRNVLILEVLCKGIREVSHVDIKRYGILLFNAYEEFPRVNSLANSFYMLGKKLESAAA